MTPQPNPKLLTGTRAVIYIGLGLIAFIAIIMALIIPVTVWKWDEAVLALAEGGKVHSPKEVIPLALGLVAVLTLALGAVWVMLRKLLAMVQSVADGSPFTLENAGRLRFVGWLMIAIQAVSVPIAFLGHKIGEAVDPSKLSDNDWGVDANSILAILLVFILAGVFEQGAAMREELEGTV
jgi:hypothetical protein